MVERREVIPQRTLVVECSYDLIGLVEQLAAKSGGAIIGGDYGEKATLTLRLPAATAEGFLETLKEASGGRVGGS